MGCVVIVPGCRGGWSSRGFYSFTNYITDIITTAHWACSPEIVQTYGIDPNSVFLSGHSVGGSSALNAARQLPWLKGVIAIAPYDLSYLFDETSCGIDFLLEIGAGVLREETPGAIQRNAMACHRNLALEQAFDDLKELNPSAHRRLSGYHRPSGKNDLPPVGQAEDTQFRRSAELHPVPLRPRFLQFPYLPHRTDRLLDRLPFPVIVLIVLLSQLLRAAGIFALLSHNLD